MTLPQKHRNETEKISKWLLNEGYYPEQYVLPPCFKVSNFTLEQNEYLPFLKSNGKENNFPMKNLAKVSFPKNHYVPRVFGIIHPKYYHDIVFCLDKKWEEINSVLFDEENKIYSYSFPIPLNSEEVGSIGDIRNGRLIYEFLEMAEKDLVAESFKYKYLVKIDITNFYNSVYTHSIAWAWEGDRKIALDKRNDWSSLGNQLDKLFHYANDKCTNGIAVGPVVSDLIIELLLSERDKKISNKLKDIDFVATRFKDDYRFLCHSDEDANVIIKAVFDILAEFNLHVNDKKTEKLTLPEGLYRKHSLDYHKYSFRTPNYSNLEKIPFKEFEASLLKAIDIHKENPGTSIIEKCLSEISFKAKLNDEKIEIGDRLKLEFVSQSIPPERRNKTLQLNLRKLISLLLHVKNISPKAISKVLAIFECLMLNPEYNAFINVDNNFRSTIYYEISKAVLNDSEFELLWWIYFIQKHNTSFPTIDDIVKHLKKEGLTKKNINEFQFTKNPFIATLRGKFPDKNGVFKDPFGGEDHNITMFKSPSQCGYLLDHLDIFNRDQEILVN